MIQIHKYPRTHHLEGSRFQHGDEELMDVPYQQIEGQFIVVEEKMDGANSGISFSVDGELQLQSRGHYLTGGPREKHFALFKTWANVWKNQLWGLLGSRYVLYGEWLYAKHTIFYNKLPHYFMEFDMLDTQTGTFLSTQKRMKILKKHLYINSVKVLFSGKQHLKQMLRDMVTKSHFISINHTNDLKQLATTQALNIEQVCLETDPTTTMEGLYIKVEADGIVKERYKYVRASFLSTVQNAQSHWLNRPIIPNQLQKGINIYQ